MADVLKPAFFVLFIFICGAQSDCILDLNKDFGNPGPVLIKDGGFLAPNADGGEFVLKRSETVLVACPGTKRRVVVANVTSGYNELEAHCIINSTFRVERQIAKFKDIKCSSQPFFSTEVEPGNCAENSQLYGVGYKIKQQFYKLYRACFDKNTLHTSYVEHELTPASVYSQNKVNRPAFVEGTLFGSAKMSALYNIKHQKSRLDAILGSKMADLYLTKQQFLTRGHLAARADYSTSAEMRGTFHYVNTAPQWMRGNAGDWAALEEALRRRVKTRGSPAVVYTGTHGVMTLPDNQNQMKEFYLHVDENNNQLVPVPMYYYKLVYDPKQKTAAAFITINSSFYNNTIINDLEFCDDICAGNKNYNWLKWRSSDGTHSFCCDYKQFVEEIDYLPKLDVIGQFY